MKKIVSRANPLYKDLRALARDRRRQRQERLALIEGAHLLASALDHGVRPECIVFAAEALTRGEIQTLRKRLDGVPMYVMPLSLIRGLSELASPPSLLACIAYPVPPMQWPKGDCLLLDGVQDPVNVGSILRTAAAAGITDVLLSTGCAGAWSQRALRAGQGAQFALSIHEGVDLIAFLGQYPGQSLAAIAHGGQPLYAIDLASPSAWIVGSEGAGVDPRLMAMASVCVTIPLASKVESLNVAAATAVCLFEMRRQRLGKIAAC
ncbi:MAG: RNA methyltransferase [Rhodocyclaceae bacterium]|nr:RNA methyltransferase [Rhodocyclaceae bacterium]